MTSGRSPATIIDYCYFTILKSVIPSFVMIQLFVTNPTAINVKIRRNVSPRIVFEMASMTVITEMMHGGIPLSIFCLIQNPQHYVLCNQTKQCISRKLLNNERCHCEVDGNYGLCVDNPSETMYIEYHISFPTICDKIEHLKSILIDGRYETDEFECEQWSCNNVYTHCNGIWECDNGEDELDCYPRSIINCSHHSYVCLSSKTYDYVCLESTKINDGQIDCLGASDEPSLCPDCIQINGAYRFCCNVTASSRLIPYSYVCDRNMDCDEGDDEHVCRHFRWGRPFDRFGICWPGYPFKISDAERFACTLFGSWSAASIRSVN